MTNTIYLYIKSYSIKNVNILLGFGYKQRKYDESVDFSSTTIFIK